MKHEVCTFSADTIFQTGPPEPTNNPVRENEIPGRGYKYCALGSTVIKLMEQMQLVK